MISANRLRQEDHKFQATQSRLAKLCLQIKRTGGVAPTIPEALYSIPITSKNKKQDLRKMDLGDGILKGR